MSNNRQELDEFIGNSDELQARRALRSALQALPQAQLPDSIEDGWQAIEQRMDGNPPTQANKRRWLRNDDWIGIAAAVLVVISVVFYRPPLSIGPAPQPVTAQQDARLQQLVVHSQQLEQQLRSLRRLDVGQVLSGQQALVRDELERMIGLVDLQIAAVEGAPPAQPDDHAFSVSERTGLWQQRVALLNELLVSQYGGQAVLINGDAATRSPDNRQPDNRQI